MMTNTPKFNPADYSDVLLQFVAEAAASDVGLSNWKDEYKRCTEAVKMPGSEFASAYGIAGEFADKDHPIRFSRMARDLSEKDCGWDETDSFWMDARSARLLAMELIRAASACEKAWEAEAKAAEDE